MSSARTPVPSVRFTGAQDPDTGEPFLEDEQVTTEEEEEEDTTIKREPAAVPPTIVNRGPEVRPDVYLPGSRVTLRLPDDPDPARGVRWFMLPSAATTKKGWTEGLAGPVEVTGLARDGGRTLQTTRTPATVGLYWAQFTDAATSTPTQQFWKVSIDLAHRRVPNRKALPTTATYLPVFPADELAASDDLDTDFNVNDARYGEPGLYVQTNGKAHLHLPPPRPEPSLAVDPAPARSLTATATERAAYTSGDGHTTWLVWLRGTVFDLRQAVGGSGDGPTTAWTPDPSGGPHSLWAVQLLDNDLDPGNPEVPLLRRRWLRSVQVPPQAAGPVALDARTIVLDGSSTGTLALPAVDAATGLALAWERYALDPTHPQAPPPSFVPPADVGARRAADDDDIGVYRAVVPDTAQFPVRDPVLAAALRSDALGAALTPDEQTELWDAVRAKQTAVQQRRQAVEARLAPLWTTPYSVFQYRRRAGQGDQIVLNLMRARLQLLQQELKLAQLGALLRTRGELVHAHNRDTVRAYVDTFTPAPAATQGALPRPSGQITRAQAQARGQQALIDLLQQYAPYYAPVFVDPLVPESLATVDETQLLPQLGRALAQDLDVAGPAQWTDAQLQLQFMVPSTVAWWQKLPRGSVPTRAYERTVRPAGVDLRTHERYDPVRPPAWGSVAWRHAVNELESPVVQWWRAAQAKSRTGPPYPLWLRLWDGEQWAAERVYRGDWRVPARTPSVFREARRDLLRWWATELEMQPGLAGRLPPGPVHEPAALTGVYGDVGDDTAVDARQETGLRPDWTAPRGMGAAEARAWRFLLAVSTRTQLQRAGGRYAPPPTWPELEPERAGRRAPGAHLRGFWLDSPSSTHLGPRVYDSLEQVLDEVVALRAIANPAKRRQTAAAWLSGARPLRRSAVFVRTDGTPAEREYTSKVALLPRFERELPAYVVDGPSHAGWRPSGRPNVAVGAQ